MPNFCRSSLLCLLALLFAGCSQTYPVNESEMDLNHSIINSYFDSQEANAALERGVLYPYHFAAGSDALTPVGERELDLLAERFRDRPGELNIRRFGTEERLYHQRVRSARIALRLRDVDPNRVTVVDVAPAGDDFEGQENWLRYQKMLAESAGITLDPQ